MSHSSRSDPYGRPERSSRDDRRDYRAREPLPASSHRAGYRDYDDPSYSSRDKDHGGRSGREYERDDYRDRGRDERYAGGERHSSRREEERGYGSSRREDERHASARDARHGKDERSDRRSRSPVSRSGARRADREYDRESDPDRNTGGAHRERREEELDRKHEGTSRSSKGKRSSATGSVDGGAVQNAGQVEVGEDEQAMMAAMGFGNFGSTKGKHVAGNSEGAANVRKERSWRQYMNRQGGFNRPLDKI
ncbi:duf1777-domain-containing protein [Ceraceosorus bombacis]|uniref:Duf1777-domain-containing protein n=1 Tax=Ceraceosorus bombacis TaxID=401625 RepID=A0A0P1BIA2_9BASI|nr:duf1777-domain-containing protein [Ceraceosorus bombacis]